MDTRWPVIQRGDPTWKALLLREMGPGVAQDLAVMDAVLANALNGTLADQHVWMKRYEAMRGRKFLWPDGSDE